MVNKSYRLKLARLLKLYQEVSTDRGLLIAENDDVLTAGVEVFIENENGEIVPAPDQVYVDVTNKVQYVVEGGTIKEIVEYKDPEETTIEDANPDNGTNDNTESNETGATTEVENPSETGETETKPEGETNENPEGEQKTETEPEGETTDAKDEQIAALTEENTSLKQQIAELEKIIAEYKKKEEEVPAQTAETREKFESQKPKTDLEKKLEAAKRLNSVLKK